MLELSYIFARFKSLPVSEKVSYLSELETYNLPYEINFERLKEVWAKIAERSETTETEGE